MTNTFLGILIGFIVLIVLYLNFKPETHREVNNIVSDTTYVAYEVKVTVKPRIELIPIQVYDTNRVNQLVALVDSLKNQMIGDYGDGYGGIYSASWDTTIVNKDTVANIGISVYSSIPFDPDLWFDVNAKFNQPIIHETQLLTPSWWSRFWDRFGFYAGAGVGYDTEGKILPNINISFGFKLN